MEDARAIARERGPIRMIGFRILTRDELSFAFDSDVGREKEVGVRLVVHPEQISVPGLVITQGNAETHAKNGGAFVEKVP